MDTSKIEKKKVQKTSTEITNPEPKRFSTFTSSKTVRLVQIVI